MGVKKKFRNHPLMGAGLAMMAIDQLRQNGKRLGKKTAELGWILEDNKATNNIIRSVGGVHYKTHRIYEKALGVSGMRARRRPCVARHPSAFAPLANRAFRGLWIANLLSNVGGWMQTTGAAWEMTSLTHRADLRGAAGGRRHPADVPVLLLRRHPGRPLRPPALHHRLPVLDDGRGRRPWRCWPSAASSTPGTFWRWPSAWASATP